MAPSRVSSAFWKFWRRTQNDVLLKEHTGARATKMTAIAASRQKSHGYEGQSQQTQGRVVFLIFVVFHRDFLLQTLDRPIQRKHRS